ncbi:MAG: hypothetical protein VB104_07540 [Candidatus Limiplasma sp.]|nr:hypothetical protein [Candidatus Limiplasma sp.]
MAVSWPFDSTLSQDTEGNPIYSRAYSSDVLARILSKYFRNGVFSDVSTSLQVEANEGMTVVVNPGAANINGRQFYEESDRVLTVQAANASLDRIDTVVLRLDLAIEALTIDLYVVPGTAAATPSAPALTRNASIYELGLANLFIAKNTTSITQQRITDTRLDSERCGVVASIIGDTDTGAYYAQVQADLAGFKAVEQAAFAAWSGTTKTAMEAWIATEQAAFAAWFATVQSTLGSDVAGNLLNLINKYKARNVTVTLAEADWVAGGGVYTQVKAVSIVPANCALHASPAWASREAYNDAECGVSAASAGSVTFTATSVPADALTVNLSVSEVDA